MKIKNVIWNHQPAQQLEKPGTAPKEKIVANFGGPCYFLNDFSGKDSCLGNTSEN